MKVIIDRFEGEYAVVELENKELLSIPRKLLPINVHEGDVISIDRDMDETNKRQKRISEKMKGLWYD